MKKYIFFIRDYNDWDNIAPIIYYLAKNSSSKICVCFYKKDLSSTALYQYLEKNIGNNLEFFFWSPKKLSLIVNYIKDFFYRIFRKIKIGKMIKPIIDISDKEIGTWFKKIEIKKFSKIVVVFDRTLGSIIDKVSKNLDGQDSIFVSCSHGPQTNVNRICYVHEMAMVQKEKELLKYFNKYKYLIISDYLELEFNDKFSNPKEKKKSN